MRLEAVIIGIFAIFIMTGCKKDFSQKNINITLIGQGNLLGNGQENISKQNLVIKSKTEWEALLIKMNSQSPVSSSFSNIDIDFNSHQVIAVFSEIKPTSGHSIDITRIIEHKDDIKVIIRRLLKGGIGTTTTQPYHIVSIPKSEKEIVFENK